MWDEGEARKLGAEEKRDQANGMKENAREGERREHSGVYSPNVLRISIKRTTYMLL